MNLHSPSKSNTNTIKQIADEIKVLGVVLDRRLSFHKHVSVWRDRAITTHRPFDTFDTCWLRNWHRSWPVVWSCPGWTTSMLCSTALKATVWRSCSECRTMQLGSFSRLQDDSTPAHCWGRYSGCRFSRGSTTKWICWRSKSAAHRRRRTSAAVA